MIVSVLSFGIGEKFQAAIRNTLKFDLPVTSQAFLLQATLFVFQTTPPFYEPENMKAPLAAWYGGKDWISVPEDVNMTLSRITNLVYKKYIPEFIHFDFIWGMQAYEQIYREILELMENSA